MKYNNVGQKTCEKVKKKLIFDKFLCFCDAKIHGILGKLGVVLLVMNYIVYLCKHINVKST